MNKKGINTSMMNPYVFEQKERSKAQSESDPPTHTTLNFFNGNTISATDSAQQNKQKITVQNITIMSQNVNLGELVKVR